MRKVIVILCFSVSLLCSCAGLGGRKEPPPRRHFESVVLNDRNSREPVLINEYQKEARRFTREAKNYAAAMLLSDLGIIGETPKERFEQYANLFFSDLPAEGQVKEIVIPNLCTSDETEIEKNAYFFIAPATDGNGVQYFTVDTNIPISSVYAPPVYDGYVIRTAQKFYKNIVPGSWAAVMEIVPKDNLIFYRGIAYPRKAAPLHATETGIKADVQSVNMLTGASVGEIRQKLLRNFNDISTRNENNYDSQDLDFLEKFTALSEAVYSYLDADITGALKHLNLAKANETETPKNAMGSIYLELEKVMDYLLNRIEL